MITNITFTIASDFKSLNLKADATTGETFNLLNIYKGSDYLNSLPIDLTTYVDGSDTIDLTLTLNDLGLASTDIIDGIVTAYLTDTSTAYAEVAIANLYYINLTLANMIVLNNVSNGWNDINTIYMLIKAITTFIPVGKIEQALNTYEKVIAMCESNPRYLITEDTLPCSKGSGCWIINGTYIIN